MSRRRGRKSKRKSGLISLKAKLIFWFIFLSLVAWLSVTLVRSFQMVSQAEPLTGHDFIAQEDPQVTTILVAQQAEQAGQLRSLAIVKVNFEQESIVTLQMPPQVSDGETSIAQYIESRYYKEAQIAAEQQLALPINAYIIQTRQQTSENPGISFVEVVLGQHPINIWDVTGGLPMILGEITPMHTSLSQQELWKVAWLAANTPEAEMATTISSTALAVEGTKATLIPEQVDPVIQEKLADAEVLKQKTTVVVKNGTSIPGLALQMSRFISNSGGEVVAVESADINQDSSSMTADSQSALSQKIGTYLGIEMSQQEKTGRERADIELIVGNDALSRLGQ